MSKKPERPDGSITPEQAEKLRVATLKNIIDKVASGGIPTAREVDMLQAATLTPPRTRRLGRPPKNEDITETDTRKILAMKRSEELELQMEILRGERLPKDDVRELLDATFANVGGLLKAHRGKVLDDVVLADIFTELQGAKL